MRIPRLGVLLKWIMPTFWAACLVFFLTTALQTGPVPTASGPRGDVVYELEKKVEGPPGSVFMAPPPLALVVKDPWYTNPAWWGVIMSGVSLIVTTVRRK